MDLTGHFPKISSSENQYILIDYHYDANYIHAAPIKNRRGNTIIEAWRTIHKAFKKAGVIPLTYVLDNKTSKDLI